MFKGDRLRNLRKNISITQKDLAKILKISKGNISRYETGIREPDLDLLIKIADFFKVTTDYLLGLTNIKNCSVNEFYINDKNNEYSINLNDISEEYLLLAKKLQDEKIDPKAIETIIPALIKQS
ncbi:helix-turn-helix transcriptional regulator [Clostridium sp. 'deep sea']|uniref:helix-turn-helix domain-containing protein n=1 Tax=Clostridium sp. 'deep sea' TaxID=2779445 RepID=UPI0018964686|nr:helix-turn-helix transcriptional regulator [Clostridium sp. 'deep sea']QOR36293.1 helix-turn-helix transcriptional regulator [Clostridium sp. 'deep sea']